MVHFMFHYIQTDYYVRICVNLLKSSAIIKYFLAIIEIYLLKLDELFLKQVLKKSINIEKKHEVICRIKLSQIKPKS